MLFCLGNVLAAAAQDCSNFGQCQVRIDNLSESTQKNVSMCFKNSPEDDCSCTCSGFHFYTPENYLQCESQCPDTRPFVYYEAKCGNTAECVARCPEDRPYVSNGLCVAKCEWFVRTSYENCKFLTEA